MLSDADRDELRRAKALLEHPGLAMKIADAVGKPAEWLLRRLPARAGDAVVSATRAALERGLEAALGTLDRQARRAPSDWLHRAAVIATGAAGGAFGLGALALELPVSTVLMLRSIADHARAQGEDLGSPEARRNCVLVFGLGGRSAADDASELGYLAARAAFARAVSDAAGYVARRGLAGAAAERGAPALARFVAAVAERFALTVSDKAAAQLVPVVGAAGGAAVNAVFMAHFQDMAWGHFTVRRLERQHGADAVREAWNAI